MTAKESLTAREQLLQELTQVSDDLVEEVLDFLLFSKSRRNRPTLQAAEDEQSREEILESLRRSLQDVKTGRTHPVAELWEGIDVE